MEIFKAIDIGPVRKNQEDAYYVGDRLFVVSDGMGGHAAGELASEAVVKVFSELDEQSLDLNKMFDAVHLANKINVSSEDNRGATCVAVFVDENDTMQCANVGDSRLYHLSKDGIAQVTNDQGVGHTLFSFVGYDEGMWVDVYEKKVSSGDILMLCSDGISDVVDIKDMAEIMTSSKDPAADLVAKAIEKNTRDNCTAIVIRL